jgi:hypothetical protein
VTPKAATNAFAPIAVDSAKEKARASGLFMVAGVQVNHFIFG